MAYRTLIFGTDDIYKNLKPFYKEQVALGNLNIVATADIQDDTVNLVYADGRQGNLNELSTFDFVIVSSSRNFYNKMKQLEAQGVSRDKIIDGRVFKMPHLDFPRFLKEGIAYGVLEKNIFEANARMIYPKFYTNTNGNITLSLGNKSYIKKDSVLEGFGIVSLGKFDSFATNQFFSLGQNKSHNYQNVAMIPLSNLDWKFPKEFWPSRGRCKILIGNDVWSGRGCTFKSTNPKKPLIIGDGAVIASDSVVVKNVPPYAIVGGNPAQIIKYRFPPEIIEALLRIKWWDWSLDKIHDNFKYFNDIDKFIALHDK